MKRQYFGRCKDALSQRGYCNLIVKTLLAYGRKAKRKDVIKWVFIEHGKERLNEKDIELLQSRDTFRFEHNMDWAAAHLRNAGILKKNTKRGIWELSDDIEKSL